MPSPAGPRRRLPVLFGLLTLLLALAVVAASHLYWQELRGRVEQLHAALALARGRQQEALERLRDAEASLAATTRQMPAPAPGPPPADGATDPRLSDRLTRAAADVERLAAALAQPPPSREGAPALQQELNALAREAMHLPPRRYLPPPGSPTPPLVLRGASLRALLRQAEDAVALGDFGLAARQVLSARRFLGYFQQEPQALALARRLEALHGRLQQPEPAAGEQARLQRLAAELRALARQAPMAPQPTPAR